MVSSASRDADAAIGHADRDDRPSIVAPTSMRPPSGENFDALSSRLCSLDEPRIVAVQRHGIGRQIDVDVLPARGQLRLDAFDAAAHDVAHGNRPVVQLELAGGDAPDVEQVVDEPRQLRDLTMHGVAALRERGGRVSQALQHADRVAQRREMVAQLVREHCDEHAEPVRRRFGSSSRLRSVMSRVILMKPQSWFE